MFVHLFCPAVTVSCSIAALCVNCVMLVWMCLTFVWLLACWHQASSKYGVVQQHNRTQKRYSRLRHLSAQPFVAGAKPKPLPYVLHVLHMAQACLLTRVHVVHVVVCVSPTHRVKPSMSLGTPYEEPWRIARSTRELANLPSQKAKRVSEAPFHTSVVGNRLFEEYERSGRVLRGGAATVGAGGGRSTAGSSRRGFRRTGGSLRGARTTGGLAHTKRSITLASEHTAI